MQYDFGRAILEFNVRDNRGSTEYINQSYPPPTFNPVDVLASQDFLNQVISLSLAGDLTPGINSRLRLSQMKDEIDQNQSASFAHTRQTQADWQNTLSLSDQSTLLAGITSTRTEAGYADASAYDKSTHSEALYLQNHWQAGAANLQAAIRHERYSTFGNQNTGSLAFGYALNGGHRIHANIGTAFHAPDLNQLYDMSYGSNNPNLQPEKSLTVEIGSRHQLGDLTLDLSLFDTSLKNLIASKNFVLFNISEASVKGAELGGRWTVGDGWYLSGNASYNKAMNEITHKELDRRPRRSLTLGGGYQLKDWGVSTDILAKGHSQDFGGRLDGYAVANVSGYWQASPELKLRLNLENIGDKHYGVAHYDTDRLYVATPFTASLSANVTF
jgi:vitamin B12 transporter